jgi:2'-5' RNA ligase
MRVFLAIDLPAEIRQALSDLQHDLRTVTRSARWVSPELIHITLKFIGEVPESRIAEINQAIAGLVWKPFRVTVRNVGFFPSARSPRVFWVGMDAPALAGLAEELDMRLERIGIDRETRAFRPHVTLARAQESRMETALITASAKYETWEFGSFTADRFYLMQSTLRPQGAIYNKLNEYPLTRT